MSIRNERENTAWHVYLKARKRWLEDAYRKKGTIGKDKIQDAIKQLHQCFQQLEILATQYRKSFIPEFSKYVKKKSFMYRIKDSPLESNSEQTSHMLQYSDYQKMKYKHRLEMIKFLSANHLKLHYIVQHLLIQDKPRLKFQMERGIDSPESMNNKKNSNFQTQQQEQTITWDSNDPNILWILLRDLAEAILQLEAMGICHTDIEMHNILLFDCDNVQDLKDPAKLRKLLGKIRFKLIDLQDAFFMDCKRHGIEANSFDEMIQFLREQQAKGYESQQDHLKSLFTYRFKNSIVPCKTEFMRQRHALSYKAIVKQKQKVLQKDGNDNLVEGLLERLNAEEVNYRAVIEYLTSIISKI